MVESDLHVVRCRPCRGTLVTGSTVALAVLHYCIGVVTSLHTPVESPSVCWSKEFKSDDRYESTRIPKRRALWCARTDFIIVCCWQDILILDKLDKIVESRCCCTSKVQVSLEHMQRITISEEEWKENIQGRWLAWQTHSPPMHRRKPSQMASFQGLKGPSVFFKPWMGRGARLITAFFKNHVLWGKVPGNSSYSCFIRRQIEAWKGKEACPI